MGENSKIGWTHHTFNPWWGCVKVSAECDHCYAETFSKRTGNNVWGPHAPRRFLSDANWKQPEKWNAAAAKSGERHRVFCSSMADVFERRNDEVGDKMSEARARLWALIRLTPNLDWLLLTKRPQNIVQLVPPSWAHDGFPENVWLGTTAGTAKTWDTRVRQLMRHNAVVRFVSVEPMLEAFVPMLDDMAYRDDTGRMVDWVIVGSESGSGARPMRTDWAWMLADECGLHDVACFVKQMATDKGRLMGDRKGEDPRWWPPGNWPRQFPEVRRHV